MQDMDENMQDVDENINGVVRLEGPRVPPNDKNRYRTIRLSNGLVALLISMPGDPLDLEETPMSDDEGFCPESGKASLTMHINVGDFSDPPDIPGLNRCTANMIEKGSVKYPQHDNFNTLINNLDGWYECQVKCESTSFEAREIPHESLRRVLDRFSKFFAEPLMSRYSLDHALDSFEEHLCNRRCSSSIAGLFLTNIAIPEHPASKMSDESVSALHDVTNERLYEEILQFRERHYSAHRMKLCLVSKFSLVAMEQYVKEFFADIPSNGLPPDDFSQFNDVYPFDPVRFRRIYRIKSCVRTFNVSLTWVMPSRITNYRSKPHDYLASLIYRKDEGSLLRYLQRKEWCTKISVSSMHFLFGDQHSNSTYSTFETSMRLTDQGLANFKQVLDALYSYINMMRREGPQIEYFNELKNIREMNFRLKKSGKILMYMEPSLGYQPADFFTASDLYFEFDPDTIKACLERLTPDAMNVIIYEEVPRNEEKMYDQWYRSNGTGTEISSDWIEHWRKIEPLPEFRYPSLNPLVVNDFTVRPILNEKPRFPIKIRSDDLLEVWWKPSIQTELRENSYIYCHWISPLPLESAANTVMLKMLSRILEKFLSEDKIMADVAGYRHFLFNDYRGIWIGTYGLNQKLPLFLQQMTKLVAESQPRITEEMFEAEKLVNSSFSKSSDSLADSVRLSITRQAHWSTIDTLNAVGDLVFDQFRDFVKRYIENIRPIFLIQGNITRNEAIQTAESCVHILNTRPLLPGAMPERVKLAIPRGVRCCRVKHLGSQIGHSYVKNIYEFPNRSLKMATMIDVFRLIVFPLTASQDLNDLYIGDAHFGINSYAIDVPATNEEPECTVDEIDDRIERFRQSLRQKFENASEDMMLAMKQDLTEKKRQECDYRDLYYELYVNWKRIISGDCQFDRAEQQLRTITSMRVGEFRAWLLRITMPVTDRRISKLSIQIDGSNPDISHNNENHETKNYSLKYLNVAPTIIDERVSDYCITDIEAFKRTLEVISSDVSMT